MYKLISPGSNRLAIQIFAASAVAALLSGCSADTTRFNDPFTNPFASNTTAKPQHLAMAKPAGTAHTAPVVAQALPPRPTTLASAAPPRVMSDTTGSIRAPARAVPSTSFGGWSSVGGTVVVVAQGDTAEALSKRYGVPQNVLLQVNGLASAAGVQPGNHLTVPIYNAASMASSPEPARVAVAAPVAAAPAPIEKRRVAVVETKTRTILVPVRTKLATSAPARVVVAAKVPARVAKAPAPIKAATLEPVAKVKIAVMQAPATAKTAPAQAPAKAERMPAPVAPKVDPTPTASVAPAATVADAAGGPEFRWPARGRIIQGFKGGAGGNDGINIAVPEGTAVKAAETGTVIYAGTEMKAYGSMVLIRHPNGFISAYANNGEIDVKKGDSVKRGQTIARSGQSGNVSSPQLHFELRKGRDPVDPTQYLAGL